MVTLQLYFDLFMWLFFTPNVCETNKTITNVLDRKEKVWMVNYVHWSHSSFFLKYRWTGLVYWHCWAGVRSHGVVPLWSIVWKSDIVRVARITNPVCRGRLATQHSFHLFLEPFIQQRIYKRVNSRIKHEHRVGNSVWGRTKHVDVIVA